MKRKSRTANRPPAESSPAPAIPPYVVKFLNSLPAGGDIIESINRTKEALRQMLGDVDRIAFYINSHFNPTYQPPEDARALCISQISPSDKPGSYAIMVQRYGYHHIRNIYMDHLRQAKFPFEQYQTPNIFIYSLPENGDHLGAIILFRLRGRKPVSAATLELMEHLQPFIHFLLTHHVYQRAYTLPKDIAFNASITEVFHDLGLTLREKEVLALRLLGLQKKTIADKLFISQETVSKHIQKILRKAGAQNFLEMFMRYYVSELEEAGSPNAADIHPLKRSPNTGEKKNREEEAIVLPQFGVLLW